MISRLRALILSALASTALAMPALGQDAPPENDGLLATLWMQRSIEYRANSIGAFVLARIRLAEALADKNWTAAPVEQKGAYQNFPPAVIIDLDETLLDNSLYQAWMVKNGKTFSNSTWVQFTDAGLSRAIPGGLDFTRHAASQGVKVFYSTNRGTDEEQATRKNLEKLGFPMGGNVDTLLMTRGRPEWTSAKGTRRAYVAASYRVLLVIGDNYGDFDDAYRGSEADRLKAFEANRARFGREWIMLANPSYGSFDTAIYGHDFKKSPAEQRKAKWDVLESWSGP